MSARPTPQHTRIARGAGTTALALALGVGPLIALVPSVSAAPKTTGKGVLKIYSASGTELPDVTSRNYPKVCAFAVYASGYTTATSVSYYFTEWPHGTAQLLPGTISLLGGAGHTGLITGLPSGMYKPYGAAAGEAGADNFKVFKVTCDSAPAPTPSPTTPPTTPPTTTPPTTPPTTPVTTPTTTPVTTPPVTTTTTPPVTATTAPPVTTTTPPVTTTTPPVTTTDGGTTGTTGTAGGGTTDTGTTDTGTTDTGTTTGTTDTGTTTGTDTGTTEGGFTGGGGLPTTVTAGSTTGTRGGGAVTTAKTLPFTGRNTGVLAVWGLASLAAGVGLVVAGNRRPAAR